MDAVGYVADGYVRIVESFPDIPPHAPGDLAVDQADGIAADGHLEGEDIHEEVFLLPAVPASQFPELHPREPRTFDEAGEVMLHDLPGKTFVARFHGGVGRKDAAGPHHLRRLFEGQTFFFHEGFDPFEDEKGRMPLVDMINPGPDTQLFEEPHPSHPEEDLLLDPHLLIGAV